MGFVLTVLTIRFPPKIIPYFFYFFIYFSHSNSDFTGNSIVKPLQQKKADGLSDLSGRFPFASEADDGLWNLITYCAATGGSLLVIGSAAGVAFMGLERKVSFGWRLDLPWDSQGRSRGKQDMYIINYNYIILYV